MDKTGMNNHKPPFLVGHGIDFHNIVQHDSVLTLAGVKVQMAYRIVANSDGDLIYHALADALLGALCLGDIGQYWSDLQSANHGMSSDIIVKHTLGMMREKGYFVSNIDVTFVSDQIMLTPQLREQMKDNIRQICSCQHVNIKATRHENPGVYRADGDVIVLLQEIGNEN